MSDSLLQVALPLALAYTMFSLGIGLTFSDFGRVFAQGKAFAIGAVAQIILLPIVAFVVVLAFGLSGSIAMGVMLLSFCPGGVTSNIISKLAKGDVALSVSLTAVVTLISVLTVPLLTSWAVVHFMGTDAPDVSIVDLAISMFLLVAAPALIGVLTRHFAPGFADRFEGLLFRIAAGVFVVVVAGALASNWGTFVENLPILGPALVTLIVLLMILGLLVAKLAGLGTTQANTISIETGIQNATVAITLSAIITGVSEGLPDMATPAGVYGILMYLVAMPFVLWFRGRANG